MRKFSYSCKTPFLLTSFFLVVFFLSGFIGFSQTTTVNIPDANFRAKLIEISGISAGSGTNITVNDISSIDSLNVSNESFATLESDKISDLSGIEAFTSLTFLNCSYNKLTSLDVSANTALTFLNCSNNRLTSLDVSANTALTILGCFDNQLMSLDVSANTALTELVCYSNQLTSLDVSANTALTTLFCSGNPLTSLDLSANTALTFLSCDENSLTSLDVSGATALTSLSCSNNQLTNLDISANTALTILGCDENSLTSLDISANTALIILSCSSNQLTSLNVANGNNSNLIIFRAMGNPNLKCIQVDEVGYSTANWNDINNIDNTANFSEDCTSLSITTNPVSLFTPTYVTLVGNILSDGGSTVTERGFVYSSVNTNLEIDGANVLKVSSGTGTGIFSKNITGLTAGTKYYYAAYATNSDGTVYGVTKSFNMFGIGSTAIPDANFERKLISLGIDSGNIDGLVNTAVIEGITSLDLSTPANSNDISDLSGIEAFTSLTTLYCRFNQLTSLDVSANTTLTTLDCSFNFKLASLDVSGATALTNLDCSSNPLTSLDVSANTALTNLDCNENSLTSLDVSANTALTNLDCISNQLMSLDVSANTALTILECGFNQLTSLDVSGATALTSLSCWRNQLTSLDVSGATALTNLDCNENSLTSLDVSSNTALTGLDCSDNQLTSLNVANGNNHNFFISFLGIIFSTFYATDNSNLMCIQVDNVAYSTANWTNKDATAVFSENCVTASNENFKVAKISIFPNPTSGILNITVNEKADYTLLNMRSQTLKKGILPTGKSEIDISSLARGIYLLSIKTDKGSFTEKVIKN